MINWELTNGGAPALDVIETSLDMCYSMWEMIIFVIQELSFPQP